MNTKIIKTENLLNLNLEKFFIYINFFHLFIFSFYFFTFNPLSVSLMTSAYC
jgi:hypothetical protein